MESKPLRGEESVTAGETYESLSPEQQEIVYADPDDNVLVLAPPGTGKTHTVIARIKYLIEQADLEPQQLLVLCFTRAAVAEIMERVRDLIQTAQVHDDLRFVSIRTFDSYATRLLLSAPEEQPSLVGAGYNARIKMATDSLRDHESSASYIVGECRHLIVDELQDVVGVRAELVKAILRLAAGGFTLLGDPAQAIYGFAAPEEESESASGSGAANQDNLINWVRGEKWPGGLKCIELAHNYRSGGPVALVGRAARDVVLNTIDDQEAYDAIASLLGMTDSVGSITSPGLALRQPQHNSVCILCRTNGELLQIGSLLARHEVPHYIRPRSTEYALPAWIGRVIGPSSRLDLSFPEFQELWQVQIGNQLEVSPQQAFSWLKRVEGKESPMLDIRELQLRLFRGHRLPDDADRITIHNREPVSLSTIHSAKGREFDHVIVLTPESDNRNNDWREEARVLYVAATRARQILSRLERHGVNGTMWPETLSSGRRRWISLRNAYYLEIGLPEDLDIGSTVSTYIHQHRGDALRLQNMLWSQTQPGTQLFIHKEQRGGHSFYFIRPHSQSGLEETDFAQLSLSFKRDLAELLREFSRSSRIHYPDYWTQARVTNVVTEVLPPYPENIHEPFSRTGFCLSIKIRGMVPIIFGGNS